MLAHSPPLPLIIDYVDEHHGITSEDEEGILLALQHHARVRRLRLMMPVPALRNIIIAFGKEFSTLEYLYVAKLTVETVMEVFPVLYNPSLLGGASVVWISLPNR